MDNSATHGRPCGEGRSTAEPRGSVLLFEGVRDRPEGVLVGEQGRGHRQGWRVGSGQAFGSRPTIKGPSVRDDAAGRDRAGRRNVDSRLWPSEEELLGED